jgi:aminoglycoside phosphotransferase (APT) family kinase protein
LAGFLVELHRKGILHGDLNLTNILYRPSDNGYHFSLIDNNRSTFVAHPSQEVCLKNMVRLTHNRELLAEIITQYARIVGWDASACITRIMQLQDEFERHKKRTGYFKSLIKHSKS